jgi:hypothetical protein
MRIALALIISLMSLAGFGQGGWDWAHFVSAEVQNDTFITEWIIPAGSFTFPAGNTGTYDAVINWGDGSTSEITAYNDADLTHTYATSDTFQISVSGTFPHFYINNGAVRTYLTAIINWGDIGTLSCDGAFWGTTNLDTVYANSNTPDFSSVSSVQLMFRGSAFNQPIGHWNVSSVTNFYAMFQDSDFNQDIGAWDVSSATSFRYMFRNGVFDQNIGDWDVSSVANFGGFLTGSLSTANYDSLLCGWAELTLQSSITLDIGVTKYSTTGESCRNSIISNFSWTINDGGLE